MIKKEFKSPRGVYKVKTFGTLHSPFQTGTVLACCPLAISLKMHLLASVDSNFRQGSHDGVLSCTNARIVKIVK